MRSAQLYHYSIPLEAGVVLRDRRLKNRDGLILRLQQDGRSGLGEIAPLPGFSTESLDQAIDAVRRWLAGWLTDVLPRADDIGLPGQMLPSAAFGISCALAELAGTLPETLPGNAVPLCSGDPDQLLVILAAMPGKKMAKLKVGLYETIRDAMLVTMLLDALPDLHLRLDANRSWTLEKALHFVSYLQGPWQQRIEFIEEPCRTPAESLAFAAASAMPIAWDESGREAGFRVQAQPGVAALVIKPGLTGSLARCQQLIDQCHAAGLTAVISSGIESSLGLTQLSRLAHWLTPQVPPGLDTLSLMQNQLIRPWPGSTLPLLSFSQLTPLPLVVQP